MSDFSKRIELLSPAKRALLQSFLLENSKKKKAADGEQTPQADRPETPAADEQVARTEMAIKASAVRQPPPIKRVRRDRVWPASFAQRRLWDFDRKVPASSLYNMPLTATRISGRLDVVALEQTFTEIVRRHEVLRTTFSSIDDEPVQVISPARPVTLTVLNLSGLTASARESEAVRIAGEEQRRHFDIARGPLYRILLLKMGVEEHVLLFTMHHIVCDGWSLGVLKREVSALYNAFSRGLPSPLPELSIQYLDYAVWQREWLSGEVIENQMRYWKQQLGENLPVLRLRTDRPRPSVQNFRHLFRGAQHTLSLGLALSDAVKSFSRQEGMTVFMALLAAFKVLLYRYSGQDDIVVGTQVAGRNRAELEPLIGYFSNTLVLRTPLSGAPSLREALRRVRKTALDAYAHQDVPFDDRFMKTIKPEQTLETYLPPFQVRFLFQNTPPVQLELVGVSLSEFSTGSTEIEAKFDLTLSILEGAEGLHGTCKYNAELFNASTIERMMNDFKLLLEEFIKDAEQPIKPLKA
jgi:hypothetical protein